MSQPGQNVNEPSPFEVATRAADWTDGGKLLLTGASDAAICQLADWYRRSGRTVPAIRALATASSALQQLAEEAFDCIVVVNVAGDPQRGGVDAGSFCSAVRAAGNMDALLVLTNTASDSLWQVACETEADVCVGAGSWDLHTLLMLIDRAIRQRSIMRDAQRKTWADSQRLGRERSDCTDLLRQQRQLLQNTSSEQLGDVGSVLPPELPLIYREVLRTYVMTAALSCAPEIKKLAQTFALAHLTPRQVLQLHLDQVELLVKGIGQRSARHIMDRANVLCLEVMVLLCECVGEQNARTWWAWRRQPVADLGVSLERRAA